MTYDDKNIPDFALQPAKEPEETEGDGFDPSPYDRILSGNHYYGKMRPSPEQRAEQKAKEQQMEEPPAIGAIFSIEDLDAPDTAETILPMEGEAVADEGIPAQFEAAFNSQPKPPEAVVPQSAAAEPLAEASLAQEAEAAPALAAEAAEEVVAGTAEEAAETEAVPSFAAEPVEEVIAEPVPAVLPKKEPAKIIPLAGAVTYSDLKVTDIREKPQTRILVEEDILVPDIKPDMAEILSMDGTVSLSDREIKASQNGEDFVKVAGDIALQTIYIPDSPAAQEPISTISSRLPFKTDWNINVSPLSHVVIKPVIESIDFTVINERKFRVKVSLTLTMREYADLEVQFFEGIRGEEVQLLKETILLTDVAARKSDSLEIDEQLTLKDGAPQPEKILKQDIHIVENHKQVTGEKAVINATVYCNVLYLASEKRQPAEGADTEALQGQEMQEETKRYPCFYQGKTEFTQFIPIDGSEGSFGSRVTFDGSGLSVSVKERPEGEDGSDGLTLSGNVLTSLEIYKNLESEIVTDIYHNAKDIDYEYSEIGTRALAGSGVTEVSVREILNVPARYGDVDKVVYISGRVKQSGSTIDQGKNVVEGVVEVSLICQAADDAKTPFKMTQDLNFRGSMEIPEIKASMISADDIAIRELWFDRINNKQIEVNAGIFISSGVFSQDTHKLIKNVCFVEKAGGREAAPCMVVYITKSGDNLWKIAKKYRTTIDTIKKINNLEQSSQLPPGTKLLIVK